MSCTNGYLLDAVSMVAPEKQKELNDALLDQFGIEQNKAFCDYTPYIGRQNIPPIKIVEMKSFGGFRRSSSNTSHESEVKKRRKKNKNKKTHRRR